MADAGALGQLLAGAGVDGDVLALPTDYRALMLAVDGIAPAAGDAAKEVLLRGPSLRPGRPSTGSR